MISFARSVLLCGAVVAVAALGPAVRPLRAQSVIISGIGTFHTVPPLPPGLTTGAFTFSASVPQSPTITGPSGPGPSPAFTLSTPVTFVQGATTTVVTGALSFYTAAAGGGIRFVPAPVVNVFWATGPVVFTGLLEGPVRTPTFVLGDYVPTGTATDPQFPVHATITRFSITQAATVVPEPSTLALVGTALMTLLGAAGRRSRA
jgi:hypothetical protein